MNKTVVLTVDDYNKILDVSEWECSTDWGWMLLLGYELALFQVSANGLVSTGNDSYQNTIIWL